MEKKTYIVKGMSCSACASGIQSKLSKIEGVESCAVNLFGESMTVEFDDNLIKDKKLIDEVNALGYKAYYEGEEVAVELVNKEQKLKKRFWISMIFLVPLMYLTMGHMVGLPVIGFLSPSTSPLYFAIAQILLTTPIVIVNFAFFTKGFRAIWKGVPNMDSLVALGSTASYVFSMLYFVGIAMNYSDLIYGHNLAMGLFFESAAMILTLVTLGKWLEEKSKKKTTKEIEKLYKLVPDVAVVERDGVEISISASDVVIGDIVIIKPGESLAVDGVVVFGESFVDKSAITGESVPVEVSVGDNVTSASINKGGFLKVRAEKVGAETTLFKIIKLVKEAGSSKAPIEQLADKISLIFVPVVVVISLLTFAVWMIIDGNFTTALNYGISVLVISCPCALGLATPLTVMVATGKGASLGILYKDAESLQRGQSITTVLFDKTATLTEGNLKVIDFVEIQETKDNFALSVASSIEKMSSHPIAESIVTFGKTKDVQIVDVANFQYFNGFGASCELDGVSYYLGNQRLMEKHNVGYDKSIVTEIENKHIGKTVLFLGSEKLLALIVVADTIKESSKGTISALKSMGIKTAMVSGDAKKTADAIAYELGIDTVYAEVLPEDKLSVVKAEQQNGVVAFVGDGINDSPALKGADVGIAMSTGTDVAIDCGSVVLIAESMMAVPTMINLSKSAVANIKVSLFWAFFYNVVGIPIAAGALSSFGIFMNPMMASFFMSFSSLFVVGNALRLNAFKYKIKKENNMEKKIYIEGMMCKHCQGKVENTLNAMESVSKVEVNLKKKIATITLTDNIDDVDLKTAIIAAGYEVTKIV